MACFLFFGIFQEYSMEYSIFQNFQYFGCFAIFLESHYSKNSKISAVLLFYGIFQIYIFQKIYLFTLGNRILEYSWNIPYSKHLIILLVYGFFLNIPFLRFLYSMEYSMEYSWNIQWNIPWNIP